MAFATLLRVGAAIGQTTVVTDKVKDKLNPCDKVALTGMLDDRMRINLEKRLLAIDSATLLSGFEHRPGAQVWIGEHVGKFLFTASNVYRYTHDPRLMALAQAMEKTYVATQLPNGYLGTYLPKDYWTEWDVWAHKYAIYGLLNYYQVTGDQQSLKTAEKAADLICRVFGPKPGQRDINTSGWHAGLASGSILGTMIDLYRYTGKPQYLRFARYILSAWESPTGPKIMSNLQRWGRVDKIGDAKAYEMLSCFVGILQYYRLTGDITYLQAMETAWRDIVNNRLYVTGTSSSFEVFQGDHQLPGTNKDDIGEGCVTVTWLQFNAQLLALTGKMRYAEEIEKSIYNHLLAAEDPLTGCVSYYTPITGIKPYKCDQGYSCCLSSVPGGISLIPFLSYARSGDQLWVLLYERGRVSDSIRGANGERLAVELDCQSDFPLGGKLVYTVHPSRPGSFGINFRVPGWASDFSATVNGQPLEPASAVEPGAADVAPGASVHPKAAVQPGAGVQPGASVHPGADGKPGSSVQPGGGDEQGAAVQPGAGVETGSSVQPGSRGESGGGDEQGAAVEPRAGVEPGSSVQPGAGIHPKAAVQPRAGAQPRAAVQPGARVQPGGSVQPVNGVHPGAAGIMHINRRWVDGDSIVVTMRMPLMRLAGGPSFPGRVAFKRGPQVLAEDSTLTAMIGSRPDRPAPDTATSPASATAGAAASTTAGAAASTAAGAAAAKTPATAGAGAAATAVSDLSPLLPKNWSGKQAYGIGGFVLTPFADAGQLNGPITIWLEDKATAR